MARDRLCKVSWKPGEIRCHVSQDSEARHVAVEYMLATGLIQVEVVEEEEERELAAKAGGKGTS